MQLNRGEYRNKVLGCFMGKNAGGTLGMRDEWHRRINHVDYYIHDINGEPLPNDDLDLQLIWLVALEEQGVKIDAHTLGDYWMLYVTPHWAEYGNSKVNMLSGLRPPFSGCVDNPYKDSCGCYIRSEIWACLAPGNPTVAVTYAYNDGIIDHGEGEGLYAEILCAAMESAAFVESDIRALLEIGLSYIPKDCDIARAVRFVMAQYDGGTPWQQARDNVIREFLSGFIFSISEEDMEKGLCGGKVGWEAPSNIGMVVLALLYGEGDFGKTICTAVNCGEDTDCTAATAGSLLGIIGGMQAIPKKWIDPIGTKLVTACLNLGELGNLGSQLPRDIFELTDRIERLAPRILAHHRTDTALTDGNSDVKDAFSLMCKSVEKLYIGEHSVKFGFDFFDIIVTYERGPKVRNGERKQLTFTLRNTYGKTPGKVNVDILHEDEALQILPGHSGVLHILRDHYFGPENSMRFQFQFGQIAGPNVRAVAQFTMPGRASTMLVPLFFLNGNFDDAYQAEAGCDACP